MRIWKGWDMADKWTPATLIYTGHALRQMFERQIDTDAVHHVVEHGQTIAEYPDDRPCPSRLLLAFVNGRPIHVVLGYDEDQDIGYIVTAYVPDPDIWQPDFKRRR